jgi:hypothetical protein
MAQEGFQIERVPCIVPRGAIAVQPGPLSGRRGQEYSSAVCDLRLLDDGFSVKLNPEWVARYQEAGKNSAYPRMYRKVLEFITKKLEGLSVPYDKIEKVSGWKPGKWEEFFWGGAAVTGGSGGLLRTEGLLGAELNKDGSPFLYQLLLEFNTGGHFWNKSYVEFAFTAAEYTMVRGFFVSKPAFAGRLELATD